MLLDRRSVIQAGLLGVGALTLPGNAAALLTARGFTHGVASGEPRQKSVMLWTRFVPDSGDRARLSWQVSATEDFARVSREGEVFAAGEHDHTVKPVAEGLEPGRWYFYRFRAADGRFSPVGRTRTLPDGPTGLFRIALFSCSNIGFGWFNAYAHAAARQDIDLVVHVGDYLYEYERGLYPSKEEALRIDEIHPAGEMIQLADYRLRFAAYRSDPDLRRLHQLFPMVAMWDDHESTNDSWKDGAQNHQPDREGPWPVRKAAAMRAYREWMPVSDNDWDSYEIGDLATLFRPETRLAGRDKQLTLTGAVGDQTDIEAALKSFRDGAWQDPARSMLGAEQEQWLASGLKQSVARGTKWQLLAQQVIMGPVVLPPEASGWLASGGSPEADKRNAIRLAGSKLGLPNNLDKWDGYPVARQRLLKSALEADSNLVVLSGDSHNAWAFDLDAGGTPAGVEFAGQSVTSAGYESSISQAKPADVERAFRGRNTTLKWADFSHRGYATIELTPQQVTGEWLFLDTIKQRSTNVVDSHRMSVVRGARRFS